MSPQEFVSHFERINDFSRNSKILLFSFYLRTFEGQAEFKTTDLRRCFRDSLIKIPNSLAQLTRSLASGRKSPLMKGKRKDTFALTIDGIDEVEKVLPDSLKNIGADGSFSEAAMVHLKKALKKVTDPNRKTFLAEAISCLGVDALRATVIMTWIVTLDHLFEYVITKKLQDFNNALHNRNGRERNLTVASQDDFGEIKESIFIETCKSAGIISKDVRKILDEKLGFRNTCAHPNTISVGEAKTVAFVEDLVDNVIAKYQV